jgi:co-chaperonin GroES (HSP10)
MIKPAKDFVLVKPVEATQGSSGLYIPTDSTEKIQRGEVVAVGPALAVSAYAPVYKVGEIVLYSVFGANELREDGKKYFLVPDKEIWATLA